MNLSKYPVFKILFPYIFGILTAYFSGFNAENITPLFLPVIIFVAFSYFLFKNRGFFQQKMAVILVFFAFAGVGFMNTSFILNKKLTGEEERIIQEQKSWIVTIVEHPKKSEKSVKVIVSFKSQYFTKKEKAILYFKRDSVTAQFKYGDVLLVNTQLSPIEKPQNPNQFDYQTFMKRKGVNFTGFVKETAWSSIGQKIPNMVKYLSHNIQQKFSQMLFDAGLSGEEYSIATALILGNSDTMDPELRAVWTAAGVSHILCVSGMHVGIVFMIMNYLLFPLNFSKRSQTIKSLILLFMVWSYANITGLAPSVMRAGTMFTFVLFGNFLQRNTNVFHSLSASLFLLLTLNPLLLFEMGFQFSYSAVFGIVLLQKPIYKLYKPKTKVVKYFWELTSVSIAAQFATAPIAIYYFGQFPNYFLIGNLVVIFLSFWVVLTGVAIMVFSFIPYVSQLIGYLLIYEIKIMNYTAKFVEALPYSTTEQISISLLQLILIYLMFGFFFYAYSNKNKNSFLYGLLLLLAITGLYMYDKTSCKNQENITIYTISKSVAINFNQHGKSILLSDSIRTKADKRYQFSIKNHERKARINSKILNIQEDYEDKTFFKKGSFIFFNGKTLYLLTGNDKLYPSSEKLKIDYLYLSRNPRLKPEVVFKIFDCDMVIIDGNNWLNLEKEWIQYCREHDVNYHSMREEGAFTSK
ncbi:MAG: competence protein ComEC family protein [Lentimicrobiaceae bacterium]|nr:competence protein ComEC family protein [Lentimicrobiaceae bacterium]